MNFTTLQGQAPCSFFLLASQANRPAVKLWTWGKVSSLPLGSFRRRLQLSHCIAGTSVIHMWNIRAYRISGHIALWQPHRGRLGLRKVLPLGGCFWQALVSVASPLQACEQHHFYGHGLICSFWWRGRQHSLMELGRVRMPKLADIATKTALCFDAVYLHMKERASQAHHHPLRH